MFLKTLAGALGLTLALSAAAGPLVSTNGNFEAGMTGWSSSGNVWLATPNGGGFWFGAGSAAQNGAYAIAFNAGDTPVNGVLSQSFATSAGSLYTVNFDFGATNCQRSCGQSILASVLGSDGSTLLASTQANGISSGPLDLFSFSFIANGSSSTLRFSDIGTNDTLWLDGVLDNVSVQAVPEPGSPALLGLGLLGLAARRRKS